MEGLTPNELKELEIYLLKKVDAENEIVISDAESAFTQFRAVLKNKVKDMLTFDMEGLMQILYRLDVPEEEVSQSFELHSVDLIAEKMTESIIQREIKRYKLRRDM